MDFFLALLLGLVQGLAEFFPLSSSGHLSWIQFFFNADHVLLTSVSMHFGTFFSLLLFYRKPLITLLKNISAPLPKNLFLKLLTASLPAGIVGYFFYSFFKHLFQEPIWAAFGFFATAGLLLSTRWISPRKTTESLDQISYLQALGVGLAQALALFPGLSRSGLTICCGIFLRMHPPLALTFSFLQAVWILGGACLFEFSQNSLENVSLGPLCAGFLSSFVFGCLALFLMKSWVHHLYRFSWYLFPLSLIGLSFYLTLLF